MRKVSGSVRAGAPQIPRSENRSVAATARRAGGVGGLVLLSILYWLIFYQTLPDNLAGMSAGGDAVVQGNTLDRIVKVAMLATSVYFIATRWSLTRSLLKNINVGAAAFLVLAPLSAVWSFDPAATILRSISLGAIVLVCFGISLARWHRRRFQQLALPPLMFILVASLVVGIVFPDRITEIGTDISQRDAWHGIANSKNQFGMFASMGAIICANTWLAREARTYWAIAGTAVAFSCLILSRSNTSLFATLVGVASMVLLMRVPVIRRRYSTLVVVAFAATILLYELVIQDVIPGVHTLLAPITSLTGKDTTFSARTVIWAVVKAHINAAPYLGTGYGAYWLGAVPTSPSYVFMSSMYFYPSEAHNGYLEVVNDLGMLGLMVLLVFLFWFMRQSLQLMRIDRSQAALYLALLFQQMVINMSESDWFSRSSTFAVLALAITCLSRGLLEGQLHPQTASPTGR
jgi:exopolysaccharide production protein ExoQ